ncbi:MAG TPA: pyrroline-5-carboxylate reductase [Myxococcales bacterium]|jgi:pyrroline-5-carboxylate reductase|nr:pyrroline-5-carboxylate reductase [Myxococcales bacterium]
MATGTRLGFIGAGNMGEALLKGLLKTQKPEQIRVSARRPERVAELEKTYGVKGGSNAEIAGSSDVLLLCVKPQILDQVLRGLEVSPSTLIISVAAGVPIAAIERRLHHGAGSPPRVVRAMPNTPATVGAGATGIALSEHATDADLATAKMVFDSVGLTVVLEESQLDAVTGLSGSGPAYLFLIIEALSDAGVKVGLSRRASMQLAAQTVLGSAKLLIESGQHPGMLKDGVTSPGGTAIAGLHTLEAGGLRNVLMNAVEAATRRSRELGEEFLRKL